jgi:hypothetical protein
MTQPDLAYVIHLVSQFMTAPHLFYYAVVIRILRYVNGILFHVLHFSSHSSLDLHIYIQILIGQVITSIVVPPRVIVSYLVILSLLGVARNSVLLPALALKLSIVLLLTPPLSFSGSIGSYMIRVSQASSFSICCDNWSAIQIVHNDVFHERIKHIKINYNFVHHHLL